VGKPRYDQEGGALMAACRAWARRAKLHLRARTMMIPARSTGNRSNPWSPWVPTFAGMTD